jgi:hypothetical protein
LFGYDVSNHQAISIPHGSLSSPSSIIHHLKLAISKEKEMKRFKISFLAAVGLVAVASLFTVCKASGANNTVYPVDTGGEAAAAPGAERATAATGGHAVFFAVAKDAADNTYAAGYQDGTDEVFYGPGVSATGNNDQSTAVLVKYNVSGTAQWATVVPLQIGDVYTEFRGVAVDGGTVYAVGRKVAQYQDDETYYSMIVLYDSNTGSIQVAQSLSGEGRSEFYAVAADGAGKVYAVGYQSGGSPYDYGNNVSVSGESHGQMNSVIVQYNSGGSAQWARSVNAGGEITHEDDFYTRFQGVAADGSGVYAVGYQDTSRAFIYGNNVSVSGSCTDFDGENAVIVHYDSGGTAQWARSVSGVDANTEFLGVATNGSGTVYAVGYQTGSDAFNYGNNKSAQGNYSDKNAVIVQYDSAGAAQWARTVNGGNNRSIFAGVAADGSGKVYAAGVQRGAGIFNYGDATAQGDNATYNALIVQYDSSGTALWAQASSGGVAQFTGVAADRSGGFTTAGAQMSAGELNYGNGVTAQGNSTSQPVVVWYK